MPLRNQMVCVCMCVFVSFNMYARVFIVMLLTLVSVACFPVTSHRPLQS